VVERRHKRCSLTKIATQMDDLEPMLSCRNLIEDVTGAVRRTIIGKHHLPWLTKTIQGLQKLINKMQQIVGLIEYGN
jgi:hypothetical protein